MTLALYRRYRSATFGELVGQEHVAVTLRNQVRRGELAHAYLFTGVRGTGKTSTARILARAAVCLDLRDGEPCNLCVACREVLSGAAVDVLEIDAASNRGIDEMRELRERVKFLPASLRRKVYIVDEAHMLTAEAWNALLKTLEEPPPHVLFVLATTEPHKVPETVRSRVQRFDFRRVAAPDVAGHLRRVVTAEGEEVEPDALALLAQAGQGSVRDSLSLLDQALAAAERPVGVGAVRRALGLADPRVMSAILLSVARADPAGALRGLDEAFAQGADARQLLREMARLARGAELAALRWPEGADTVGDEVALCAEMGAVAPGGLWIDAIDRFAEAEINLRQPVDARLQVELALLKLTTAGTEPARPLRELAERIARLEAAVGPAGALGGTPPAASTPGPDLATRAGPDAPVTPAARPGFEASTDGAPTATGPAAAMSGATLHEFDPTGTEPTTTASAAAAAAAATTGAVALEPAAATRPRAASGPSADGVTGEAGADATGPDAGEGQGSEIREGWRALYPRLVDAVNRRDPMLAGVLRSCRPLDGSSGRIVIGAPFGFHLERLRDPQKMPLLAEAAAGVAGRPVVVECVFSGERPEEPERTGEPRPGEDATAAVLAAFPGSRVTGTRLRDAPLDGAP